MVSRARGSISLPACHGPVPALSATTRSASPASASKLVKTTSAVGERQMLPVHTKQTRTGAMLIGSGVFQRTRAETVLQQRHRSGLRVRTGSSRAADLVAFFIDIIGLVGLSDGRRGLGGPATGAGRLGDR